MTEKVIAEVKALIAAPSCCAEAKAAAERWLAAVGTDSEAEETKSSLPSLKRTSSRSTTLLLLQARPSARSFSETRLRDSSPTQRSSKHRAQNTATARLVQPAQIFLSF